MSPGPWIATAAVLLVAAAAYWWFVVRIENTITAPPAQDTPALPAPADEPPVDEADAVPGQQEAPAERPGETTEEPEQAADIAAPAERAVQDTPPAIDAMRLTLNFSGECWTEINDAEGQQLFFSMGRAGQTVELSGKAPITALFGNADNVDVFVNDNVYALPEPNAANRTVRVAILNQ
jgi:cytoskeleton protein RodZ